MNEEWKLIEGFNNRYKINKNGVIVNTETQKILKSYITPVPSYEGFMTLVRAYDEVVDEYTNLKELLKSSKEIIKLYLKWYEEDCGSKDIETEEIMAKINQALGEDK